ncbi:MAG: hypothetical protein U9Q81_17535 [Pseudomonadota bacterium]|nr:hypothetical protein [Pseudomonadota bacterium]
MNQVATTAIAATLLAVAGAASGWEGWHSAQQEAARQGPALGGGAQEMVPDGLEPRLSSANQDAADAPSAQTYYGWRYPYAFPFGSPLVTAQKPITGERR